jgi:hypothetical protein
MKEKDGEVYLEATDEVLRNFPPDVYQSHSQGSQIGQKGKKKKVMEGERDQRTDNMGGLKYKRKL